MGGLMFGLLCAAGGLIVGWFLLPAPKFVQEMWIKAGWADRVP